MRAYDCHQRALECLERGQPDDALAWWHKAAELADAEGDQDAKDQVLLRIGLTN
jgi:hypothetical protein